MSDLHRGKRPATTPSLVPDWSSLAPDLVSCIGDIFLAAGDIDYYMALRAVCHPWRAATDDPCGPDPRFRPRGWAMLGSLHGNIAEDHNSRRLFLNVNTGRFLWKDMPILSKYVCLAADDTDGLLVLRGAHLTIRILNPFTGHMVSHNPSSAILGLATETLKVTVDDEPMSSLYTWNSCHDIRNKASLTNHECHSSTALVTFQHGRTYKMDEEGKVSVVEEQDRSGRLQVRPVPFPRVREPIHMVLEIDDPEAPLHNFLVNSSGELLLVRLRTTESHGAAQIFSVNLDDKTLHAVMSIGSRAILLGNRCLSVDARNLPGIECNCIYYIGGEMSETRTICIYHIEDGSHEKLFEPSPNKMISPRIRLPPVLPLSLHEVLMDYPKQVDSRFGSACPTWEY